MLKTTFMSWNNLKTLLSVGIQNDFLEIYRLFQFASLNERNLIEKLLSNYKLIKNKLSEKF